MKYLQPIRHYKHQNDLFHTRGIMLSTLGQHLQLVSCSQDAVLLYFTEVHHGSTNKLWNILYNPSLSFLLAFGSCMLGSRRENKRFAELPNE